MTTSPNKVQQLTLARRCPYRRTQELPEFLIEAVCDIALSLILYVLLRPVRKNIALLAAFFGLVSTAVFAASELFYLAPSLKRQLEVETEQWPAVVLAMTNALKAT